MWLIFFLFISVAQCDEISCKDRCIRIYQRTLARVGFDDAKLRELLEKQRPLGTIKDICWRVYDHLDCMKHCESLESHENFANFVRSKCQSPLKEIEDALSCVSRYHSFMEVQCSTFLNEAERLKKNMDPFITPTQEICKFLHLNSLCLENTVTIHCANAKKIFRRLNFRDYFPSFILPANDTLMDDVDLDACQMYDFVKKDIRRIEEPHSKKESAAVVNFFEARDAVIPPIGITDTSESELERKEFTELLDELLDESTTTFPPTTLLTSSAATQITTAVTATEDDEKTVVTTIVDTTEAIPTTLSTSLPNITSTSLNVTETADMTEEYDDYSEMMENISVNVVPIQHMNSSADVQLGSLPTTKEPIEYPVKSRLFNEDSWEHTPPNFRYSSLRVPNGGVIPLNIDTTTLFGFDDDEENSVNIDDVNDAYSHENDKHKEGEEIEDESKTLLKKGALSEKLQLKPIEFSQKLTENVKKPLEEILQRVQSIALMSDENGTTTSSKDYNQSENETSDLISNVMNSRSLDKRINLLEPLPTSSVSVEHGDVMIAKIQDWNEVDRSQQYDIHDTEVVTENDDDNDGDYLNAADHHLKVSMAVDDQAVLPDNTNDWFDQDTLLLIYCLLFGITILALMCLLICLVWCQKADQSSKSTYY